MWGRKRTPANDAPSGEPPARRLRDALRQVRIESAERSAVVVDLRDAELARLEALDEAFNPLFSEIPADVELFDRGISRGDPSRLWIDVVSYIVMGRDKRMYRFLQDTRNGRIVLAESTEIPEVVEAVTKYIARRLVERERALAADGSAPRAGLAYDTGFRGRSRWRAVRVFLLGLVIGFIALFAIIWQLATRT